MTTYTNSINSPDAAIQVFKQLGVDDQLAFLWYVYEEMGDRITPAAPGSASPEIAGGLLEQVKQQSHPEQLETMRRIARQDQSSQISREYGSLGPDTKLAFWYFLAQGMDEGTIIPMPDDYEFSDQDQDLLAAIETMDFEFQITVLRNAVLPMGAEPKSGAAV